MYRSIRGIDYKDNIGLKLWTKKYFKNTLKIICLYQINELFLLHQVKI